MALFADWCVVAEAVAATTKKLQKSAILADYLPRLSDADLAIACRFFAGAPFPANDERVLQIGGAVVRDAVISITGLAADEWYRLTVEWGESGLAAAQVLPGHVADQPSLQLADVLTVYEQLQAARGPTRKTPILIEALRRCTVVEAKYLIKIMGGDLRIGLQEGQLEDALARLAGVPVAEVQWTNMLLGDIGETALLLRHGRQREARMRLFHPLKFMLASPIQDPSEIRRSIAGAFFVEDKYDGIRAQVHKQAGQVALFSRTLDQVTHRFPELIAPLRSLPGEFILDGEVLAARDRQILPFKELQQRLGRKDVSAELQAATPVIFVAYDILYQDGEVLIEIPLSERRRRLDALPLAEPLRTSLLTVVDDVDQIDPLFEAARGRGNEGLMVKDPASAYKPGRRGREWLKVKKAFATLDVVVTAAEVGTGNRRRFLSDYTFAVRRSRENGELLNIGKAYSGLTDVEVAALTDWFQAHTLKDFGRVKLVEPKIVLEVAFDTVQPSTRHKSGYALRFPRIVRWRTDKPIDEIDTLETVRALAGSALEGDLADRVTCRTGSSTIEELET
jgi:DNA ligase-1